MRKSICVAFISAVMFAAPTAAFAVDSASPSPTPSLTSKHVLTQVQKDAISAARAKFAAEKVDVQNGFDRALADAQAIRDQAILAAGTDKSAISAAKKTYRLSYRTILSAYKGDLSKAKAALKATLASVYSMHTTN